MAAAAVARFYEDERVIATLAGNSDADRVLQSLKPRSDGDKGDEIWITDLSWSSPATAEHLNGLAARGVNIYWIDHHRTAVSRAGAPEFKVQFAGRVLSEELSAALLTFEYLRSAADRLAPGRDHSRFLSFRRFAELADDHDRWIHRLPESSDWALAVQTLGGTASYREIIKLREPVMSRRLKMALAQGQDALRRSVELANATMVDRRLPNGTSIRTACCFGYSSEVAAHLYKGQRQTVVALFDLRSQGVSLRRSPDCNVDLSALAESFGGGGHPGASGFTLHDLRRLPAERLADLLSQKLSASGA